MRALIQRVASASVAVGGNQRAAIGRGLLVLIGCEAVDLDEDAEWLAGKIARLRIFSDVEGKMNLALAEVGGEVLVVSQFTLFASTKQGNRPSFVRAARPESAVPLYQSFLGHLQRELGFAVKTGEFGADMQVGLVNDGPVTLFIDSRNRE